MGVRQPPEALRDKIEMVYSGSGYHVGNLRRYSQGGILFSPRTDSNCVRSYWIIFSFGQWPINSSQVPQELTGVGMAVPCEWTSSCLESSCIKTSIGKARTEEQLSGLSYCFPAVMEDLHRGESPYV